MQFNHKTKEYFNPDLIDILEGVAKDIGTALMRKQANRDLHIVNSVLTSVLESTTDGILVVGLDEKVITYSKSFLELWGIPSELMAKRDDVSLLDFVLDQLVDPKAFMERVTQLYASQDVASDEIIFKDGRVFDRFSQPYISCGIIKGRVWSFRNITKRIRAIREKTKLTKILLDSLPCVAILVNCTTREILALNDRAAKEGCEVGKTCYGSWPKLEEPCSYCLAPEACKDNVDKHIIIKEGEIIWDVYWLPVDNELVVHYALDITDIMRAEEVLNKVKANLLISAVKLEGKKILSIDDNPTYVESVKATVERFLPECIFISALNGKDGIELAIKENPDVILLDVKMPGLDGFQVCDVLKTNEQTKSIPIVFLTGVHTDPESRLKAVACGAEALYPKPLLGPDLVSIVKTMSKIKQLQT